MANTPIYALTEWGAAQNSPWIPHNKALRALEAAARGSVVDRDLDAAPGSCADGACYLVAATPAGGDAWEGQTGKMAIAVGVNASNGWIFITIATEGQFLWVEDEAVRIQYAGAVWAEVSLGNSQQATLTAAEAIGGGDTGFVHIDASGDIELADATDDTKPCDGYCPIAIGNGDDGKVYTPGQVITGMSGLTPGSDYFLSTTAGEITDTPPSSPADDGSGKLIQRVGKAISVSSIIFNPYPGVTL